MNRETNPKVDLDEIYRGMLELLVPHRGARNAYLKACGGDAAEAIDRMTEDITAFQQGKASHPYSSVMNDIPT